MSWGGGTSLAGSRALRHELDYREPFASMKDDKINGRLVDELLGRLRRLGVRELMVEAAQALGPEQRRTAYALAAEIIRSNGPLVEEETSHPRKPGCHPFYGSGGHGCGCMEAWSTAP